MTLMVVSDSDLLRWGENLLGRGENAPKVGRKLALKRMLKGQEGYASLSLKSSGL
jgi:hypothetical protein